MIKCGTKNLFGDDDSSRLQHGRVIRVAFDAGVDNVYDYLVEDSLWPVKRGQRVEVPFGRSNKSTVGFCVEIVSSSDTEKKAKGFRLKKVKRVVDKAALFDDSLMELADWISRYYVCPLGQVLSAMVPAAVRKGVGVKRQGYAYLAIEDRAEIKEIRKSLRSAKQKAIVDVLVGLSAYSAEHGINKNDLIEEAGCTDVPLKRLVQNGIVEMDFRMVYKSPPAIPENFTNPERKVVLNDDQINALAKINGDIDSGNFAVDLLFGVTDSGKTEVYIRAIQHTVNCGKSAIVLLPEIALTTQTIRRFSSRFERIAVMHSQLTAVQRNAQWQKIRSGDADVVIGARSAVFAPLPNLGLIVVDEEHEPSYKQDNAPRYHGRDVAIKRTHQAGAVCLLGSATPSLESLINCKNKEHYTLVELPNRVMDLPMPEMVPVDMSREYRGKGGGGINLVSEELEEKIREVIGRGEQAILLLNRRGYSNFVFCPGCGHSLHCRNCDITLTFHKKKGVEKKQTVLGSHMGHGFAVCHYCMAKTLVPENCPLCKSQMTMIGLGSQRLEEEVRRKIGGARIARVDSDSMDAGGYFKLLSDFAEGKIDLLAGTQILAKGLHFPNVTLVGIISADTALSLPDFRANERTFQLLTQVAGRTGRSEKPGTVIVQTFMPDQPAIRYALGYDFKEFVRAELEHRGKCNLPPYWRMAIVWMKDTNFDRLEQGCKEAKRRLDLIITNTGLKVKVRGPMPATISRIHSFHRMQIIIQAREISTINELFDRFRQMGTIRPAIKLSIDIDPVNLM